MSRIDMRPGTIRGNYRNWLNRRAHIRGKSPLPERATRPLRSSLPVYRDRINPATGRKHRDDAWLGRHRDESLARMKADRDAQQRRFEGEQARVRNARAEANQQSVRDTLARRDPQYAQTLKRAERDPRVMTAMRDRSRATRTGRSR